MQKEQTTNHDELLAKYDKESAYRVNLQKWAWIVSILAISLTVFQLYTAFKGPYVSLIQGAIHLGSALALIFILYPAKQSMLNKPGVAWYDAILALLALGANLYIVINYTRLTTQAVIRGYNDVDVIIATLGVLLLLEATRRAVGLPIVIIASLAILYGLFGQYFPIASYRHPGFDWERLVTRLFFRTEAIFGIPIQISSTYIYLFLFFGVMLTKTHIGKFFNDLAFGATGRMTGGTAKAAVAASALQGMVTGSSVANTVGSGSFTIPMMKRAGFKPEFAGATEASASTGGQIMPPIMGAAAFIMAEYTNTAYSEIIIIAIIPAILYFSGVFMGTHFQAKKQGILGLPKSQLPTFKGLAKRMDLLLPLVTIVGMLLQGYTATTAALWGIGAAFFVSLFRKDTRLSFRDIIDAFEQGARVALPVIVACASAGIIVGIVVTTGLGGKLAGGIIDLAGGSLFFLLVYTMLACIVLGMGLPTTANYVVTASMAAPALVAFDIPVMAAHFFVFYFGIVADITPPVCLAAYAGAGIARANPMKTGVVAVKLAIAAFIIPYAFVYNPVLLLQDWTWLTLLPAVLTALIGMAAVSASIMNYFIIKPNVIERLLLFTAGLALIYPNNLYISMSGLGVFILIGVFQYLREKKNSHDKGLAT
ncbi:TRAP transporter permease [Halalkalibacter nanhaiisediminis]|uniref:TRAP transporter 4TM/12TM fusion protein n=1 Tax=Halalkalibacter nanhaiisediminis TaxID=688079 RepID=A0A562QKA0_9BACI|nr:TRAP transporter permease [Halalkalibacter nanhaiisediminis]TWI57182.1 TRAP transporter 4TM/12TM fusion protein [Halalkalibacter nanhaiisediminis]